MKTATVKSEAGKLYAAAYGAQYTEKGLLEALKLYKSIVAAYPDTPEAGFSRAQIQNIVKAVVPKQELLDAHLGLALAHLAQEMPAGGESAWAKPRAAYSAT
jgi:hypothetical protein